MSFYSKLNPKLTLYKFRVFVGFAALVLMFFVATSGTVKPLSNMAAEKESSKDLLEHTSINLKKAKAYTLRKEALKDALDVYFKKAIASGEIVGAGVSIVQGDSIIISDGFGKKNQHGNDTINGQTVFRLGSLSKGFAGILVADLKDEGSLAWNDKVVDYLPEFQLGDCRNTEAITIGHILSHTSGTSYHSFTNLVEAGLPMATIADRFKEVTPISTPGRMYSYQNAMFALSGEIIHKASGQKIDAALKQHFFKPLGMHTVSMDHKTLVKAKNVAMPHTKKGNGWKPIALTDNYYNAIAAGGINASSLDMGKWMRFLLGHNPDVLSKTALSEAFNPFIEIPGRNKYYHRWPGHQKSYYGYGWRIHKFLEGDATTEKLIWHHGGSVNNYRNEIAIYPEADLGICVLLNTNSKLARTVIPDLYKIVNDIDKRFSLNNTADTNVHAIVHNQ